MSICYNWWKVCKNLKFIFHKVCPIMFAKVCIIFFLLWVLMFWINFIAIGYYLMHCNLSLPCAWNVGKKLQTHLPKLISLMIVIMELSLNCLCLLPISRRKFLVSWNFLFILKKIWKKKVSQNVKLMLELLSSIFFHWPWSRGEHWIW